MDWLLLIHQIPAKPSYFRAKIWRRLQQVGAVAIKPAVYVMPATPSAKEDFGWIAKEITDSGGEAVLVKARFLEGLSDASIISLFQSTRKEDFKKLQTEAAILLDLWSETEKTDAFRTECKGSLHRLRNAFSRLQEIDFFPDPEPNPLHAIFRKMEASFQKPPEPRRPALPAIPAEIRHKTWVTRCDIHVDRMASAWFIRRFIDPTARLKFIAKTPYSRLPQEIRYDMMEAEYTHEGACCTFEVLVRTFAPDESGLGKLAGIIHDIDLMEDAFGFSETPGVKAVFDGIIAAESDDLARVTKASALLNQLLAGFQVTK